MIVRWGAFGEDMNMKKRTFLSALTAIALSAAPALAADLVRQDDGANADCTCLTKSAGSGSIPVGSVISSKGSVQATGANGSLAKAPVGTLLRDRSTVVTGADGSASILVGRDCRLDVPASSQATISTNDKQICVMLMSDGGAIPADVASAAPSAPASGPVVPGSVHPMTVPLLVLAGSGVAYLLGDDGHGPSSR